MESDLVNDVVEDVLEKLYRKYPFEVNKELVGIEKKYEKMESLLRIGSNEVRTLVLWGMGGIGKTTLAKHLYAKLCSQFEHHCFIENIREESTPVFKNKLAHERSLIVLDDVTTLEQAENVNKYLGQGSRVIITTRDRQICNLLDNCEIYDFEEMNADESLQLFCQNAFGKKCPKDGYDNLSEQAILYCRGNPLALKVLGANIRTNKSKKGWESELEKLKKIPNRKIHDVLKLSYDDLDRTQQDIFLDIACFSRPRDYEYSLTQKDYLTAEWNSCKFYAESGLEVLLDKALIYFDFNGSFSSHIIAMHDLLKEMGKEIVMTESVKHPGRRSRLWDQNDVYDVLKYNKGTEVVEVIEFNIDQLGDLYLNSDCFKNMTNLRHLHITTDIYDRESRLHLLEGLECLSDKLRHLYWDSFPLESLPSTFCAEWLVQLKMQNSKLKKLWNGTQRLDNLMLLDLNNSQDLIEIPDLSRAPNLQVVSLSCCVSLHQLHPSIFSAPKLKELDLSYCCNLEFLPDNVQNNSMLEILYLNECMILKSLPKLPVSLRSLAAHNCIHLDTISIEQSILENMLHKLRSPENMLPKLCSAENIPKLRSPENILKMLEFMLHKLHSVGIMLPKFYLAENMLRNIPTHPWELFIFPGGEVPSEFYFQTTKDSIVIPPIPKYGLCGFIICCILSRELCNMSSIREIFCTIYQHTKEIVRYRKRYVSRALFLDHVLLGCIGCLNSDWMKIGSESGCDHYNLSFKFNYKDDQRKTSPWIKSCGVILVYDWKHSFGMDNRNSGVEIIEMQSNAHLSDDSHDINESQPQEIGAENAAHQHQLIIPPTENIELNDKSSCACSLDIMTHGPNRDIHGRTAQHASVQRERMRVVSQVTDGAVVAANAPDTLAPAEPFLSALVEGLSTFVPPEGPSPATTTPRRPRDNAEDFSQIPPPADVVVAVLLLLLMCL